MPELPEIFNLSVQMNQELSGRKIVDLEVRQEKCLNTSWPEFRSLVLHKRIGSVSSRGKWIFVKLELDTVFLLSLGMGGDVLYHRAEETLPAKYQIRFDFDDQSRLTIRFWWFGYAHAVWENELHNHKMTADLGLSPLDDAEFTYDRFVNLLNEKKGAVKTWLMDQKYIAGIGNVYIQDILFKAKLHPTRKIPQITEPERQLLYQVIKENLKEATELRGLAYEKDLYNHPGGIKDFLVGYREGQPCPDCGILIEKIKTGSTSTFICPSCQK